MQGSNESPASLRFGHVTDYDPKKHMARVAFPDLGITSQWLPIIVHNSLKNHDELHLDKDEHVACIMAGTGTELGTILGAFYDDKNKPPKADENIRSIVFEDDTEITYDRKEHKLSIICKGDIQITADGNITLNAARIDLN